MAERLRLFVAVDLPGEVRRALVRWAAQAAPPEVRRVAEANVHLTLAFLGSRSPEEAEAVTELLPGLACDVGELRTAGALWLAPRRPAVLAVALAAAPGLSALQQTLVAALAEAIGYEPEHRRFRPHVTVGRVRRGARVRARELPAPPLMGFAAEALTLYRSWTGPGGSRYEALVRVSL
jgi:RNA 2',3'-cyclic 3'-phosphodiesterase